MSKHMSEHMSKHMSQHLGGVLQLGLPADRRLHLDDRRLLGLGLRLGDRDL